LGLALAERLLAKGEKVCLFALSPPPDELLAKLGNDRLSVALGDIRSPSDLDTAIRDSGARLMVHAAAITPGLEREKNDARIILDVNIAGTVNAMERAMAHRMKRIVVVSSVAVYGFNPPAASGFYEEDSCSPAPAALYGISKLAAEQTALRLAALHGFETRVVRLGPLFGPWEYATGLRDAMSPHLQILALAQAGQPVVLPRPLRTDWLYSRQAAMALAKLTLAETIKHPLCNLGGGKVSDLSDWCSALETAGLPVDWRMAKDGEASGIQYGLMQDRAGLSIERLADETGFRPSSDLVAHARDYIDWTNQ
jgi:nucleoside-diphosphate-sugar epimerase